MWLCPLLAVTISRAMCGKPSMYFFCFLWDNWRSFCTAHWKTRAKVDNYWSEGSIYDIQKYVVCLNVIVQEANVMHMDLGAGKLSDDVQPGSSVRDHSTGWCIVTDLKFSQSLWNCIIMWKGSRFLQTPNSNGTLEWSLSFLTMQALLTSSWWTLSYTWPCVLPLCALTTKFLPTTSIPLYEVR